MCASDPYRRGNGGRAGRGLSEATSESAIHDRAGYLKSVEQFARLRRQAGPASQPHLKCNANRQRVKRELGWWDKVKELPRRLDALAGHSVAKTKAVHPPRWMYRCCLRDVRETAYFAEVLVRDGIHTQR
jgi:hypothetical protein